MTTSLSAISSQVQEMLEHRVESEGVVSLVNVTQTYGPRRSKVTAVRDASLDVRRGETLGLVGESGSGKSTLGRILVGLENPKSGSVEFRGTPLTALSRRDRRAFHGRVQMVFQDPVSSLNRRKTVEQILGLPLTVQGNLRGSSRHERILELLSLVGMSPEYLHRYPSSLSGGQCQRIGIARALATTPDLIVLDESVSALDVSVQAQILNLLRDIQGTLALSFLFVSHDLAVVRFMADRIAVMYRGAIVESADRDALFANPAHPYTQELLAAIPAIDSSQLPPRSEKLATSDGETTSSALTGCSYRSSCPLFARRPDDLCRDVAPQALLIAPGHHAACHRIDA